MDNQKHFTPADRLVYDLHTHDPSIGDVFLRTGTLPGVYYEMIFMVQGWFLPGKDDDLDDASRKILTEATAGAVIVEYPNRITIEYYSNRAEYNARRMTAEHFHVKALRQMEFEADMDEKSQAAGDLSALLGED